ncbi:hypothetical protein SDC9_150498 [bioreactor metagenome]|uniref:Uncharacterized protein n=1 Tax=bioreactor metagenome TaxID=1076179 RepID=A0A645EMN4_9ZZZZ
MDSELSLLLVRLKFSGQDHVSCVLTHCDEMILIINDFLRHSPKVLEGILVAANGITCREGAVLPFHITVA